MNLVTLLDNMLRLGCWGVSTLYHMAVRLLVGLLLAFFPDELVRWAIVEGVVGSVVTEEIAWMGARVMGFHMVAEGILFGLFGSVADPKARARLALYAVFLDTGGVIFHVGHLYLAWGLLTYTASFAALGAHCMGLLLWGTCLWHLATPRSKRGTAGSTSTRPKSKHA